MSIERGNGCVTPGSIAAKCCAACSVTDAQRDEMLKRLHTRIADLFTSEELFSHEIAEVLTTDASFDVSVLRSTQASFIRKVIAKTVDKEIAREIRSKQRAAMLDARRDDINAARDAHMRTTGKFVWESDETEILMRMMNHENYLHPVDRITIRKGNPRKRARHCNIEAMLDALKYVYPERDFTHENLVSKIEYLRSIERKKSKPPIVCDQQTPQAPQYD